MVLWCDDDESVDGSPDVNSGWQGQSSSLLSSATVALIDDRRQFLPSVIGPIEQIVPRGGRVDDRHVVRHLESGIEVGADRSGLSQGCQEIRGEVP